MALRIVANVDVSGNAIAGSKNIARSLNGINFDSTGSYEIDSYTKDEFNNIISVLPISNYVAPPILPTNFLVGFQGVAPLILAGKYYELQKKVINLSNIKPDPTNSVFQVYIELEQGLAKYVISEEIKSTLYNSLWIGTVTTNNVQIIEADIQSRSRLDIFSPSIDAAGSSFPVSQGNPSDTGTINW